VKRKLRILGLGHSTSQRRTLLLRYNRERLGDLRKRLRCGEKKAESAMRGLIRRSEEQVSKEKCNKSGVTHTEWQNEHLEQVQEGRENDGKESRGNTLQENAQAQTKEGARGGRKLKQNGPHPDARERSREIYQGDFFKTCRDAGRTGGYPSLLIKGDLEKEGRRRTPS